jgi:hypothetical protein
MTAIKPIARIDEPYVNEKWVLCTVHFGWHHERITCEHPRDDSGHSSINTQPRKDEEG